MKCSMLESYLDKYMDDDLSIDEARELGEHVESCEACAREYTATVRLKKLMDEMGEEDRQRIKRWRNYKPKSKPKNTDTITYQWATAFEALVGYLYLNEDEERLGWLMERSFEMIDGID